MITNITLENFKCFRKVEVNPRRITVFVGPNGSGKSSVLQALLLLKQSVGSNEIRLNGGLLNFAEAESIAPRFKNDLNPMHLTFGGKAREPNLGVYGFGNTTQYSSSGTYLNGSLQTRSGSLSFVFEDAEHTFEIADESVQLSDSVQIGPFLLNVQLLREIAHIATIQDWVAQPAPSLQAREGIVQLLTIPQSVLTEMRFVPATRGFARPTYNLGSALETDISPGKGLDQQDQQIATNLGYDRDLEDTISALVSRVTNTGVSVRVVPSRSVAVRAVSPVGYVNIVTEGFGTNALILLFWQIASASKDATILIEEPEIHLHPRAQADLASVLADVAKSEEKQLIMTTHSEHILGRLLTLVAEGTLTPDELAIYAFEKDEKGVCTANELEVTNEGKVKGGIKDFFESDLEELNRYITALQSRE